MNKKTDRRTARTRAALVTAFAELVHDGRRVESIRIGDIIDRANVGRSTFYEHFNNREHILAVAFEPMFDVLSSTVSEKQDAAYFEEWLEYAWSEREIGRSLFGSTNRRAITKALVRALAERLRQQKTPATRSRASTSIASVALADALVASIYAWVQGEILCTPKELAETLKRMAKASSQ